MAQLTDGSLIKHYWREAGAQLESTGAAMQEALGSHRARHKLGEVAAACNLSTWKVEGQGQPQLHS